MSELVETVVCVTVATFGIALAIRLHWESEVKRGR
jgi:hypothetical protein